MAFRVLALGVLSLVLLALVSPVRGQTCWRKTPCSNFTETPFPGVWETDIYAPASRTVAPRAVLSADASQVVSPYPGSETKLQGNGSRIVFDFGKEVGGIVTVRYQAEGDGGSGAVGIAFTEARDWVGEWSDSSNGRFLPDGALYANFTGTGKHTYTMPDEKLRGGFRYMTLFLVTPSPAVAVTVEGVSLEIGFQPTWSNLRAYQGYFHCDDAVLNRIWYAGAYTLQTNLVPVNTGRHWPSRGRGWTNDGVLGKGNTIIVDGAKRDRAVWPGDMGVAVPSMFVSLGDLESVKNALQVIYDHQNPDGSFPEAGPPLLQQNSDTYHMWSMIGTYNYVLYTNDTAFLLGNWPKYLDAMDFITAKQTYASGLLEVTGKRDWGRLHTGLNMSEAQMILYRTLNTGAELATWAGDRSGLAAKWTTAAAALRNATLDHCFDNGHGAFMDTAVKGNTLYPQDANAMSILFGVVDPWSPTGQRISARLVDNWGPLGAETPELPGNISPFISSLEMQAHLAAGQTARALDLARRSWGWYLAHPNGTQSTLVEGYLTDGSWGYRAYNGYSNDSSYISHAHGWSAGPTSALTEYVLGLRVTAPRGTGWDFAPQFGDLSTARGGFVTDLGRFEASWAATRGGGGDAEQYHANLTTPSASSGRLILPSIKQGVMPRVLLDGVAATPRWHRQSGSGVVASTVVLEVGGGMHSIEVS